MHSEVSDVAILVKEVQPSLALVSAQQVAVTQQLQLRELGVTVW